MQRCFVVCHASIWDALKPWRDARAGQFILNRVEPDQCVTLATADPAHVVLVGHPRGEGAWALPTATHPPAYRHMGGPFSGDHALVHGSLDAPPRHAVGRLPVRSADDLARLLPRLLSAPVTPPTLHLVDGDPKWGFPLDWSCDQLARLCSRLKPRPQDRLIRHSFNPRHPDTEEALHLSLRPGTRTFVYIGHGQPGCVDGLRAEALPSTAMPIPLAVLACCHAGRLTDAQPSLAERWLLSEGGPTAVVAASEVSDPRLNPSLALACAFAAAKTGVTMGEVFLAGQHAFLTGRVPWWAASLRASAPPALRRAHVGLYNLMGDPTLRFRD